MAPVSALILTLLGSALWIGTGKTWVSCLISQSLSILAFLFSLLGVVGYAYHEERFFNIASTTQVAFHGVLLFLVSSVGVLFLDPEKGVLEPVTSGWMGGRIFRRHLLVVVLAPVVVGWVIEHGSLAGFYDPEMSFTLFTVLTIVIFAGFVWSSAIVFNALDRSRRQTLDSLADSEALHRLIFEANPQPMWVYGDEDFRFLAVNAAAVEHFGYSREEFLNMTPLQLRTPEDAGRFAEVMDSSSPSTLTSAGPWSLVKKDGSIIRAEIRGNKIRFANRNACLALIIDITERLQVEEERHRLLESEQKARGAAEKATALREELLAVVSHDLKNPLTAIELSQGVLDRIARAPDGKEALIRAQNDHIRSAVHRMRTLITDLLDFARIRQENLVLDRKKSPVAQILQELKAIFDPLASEKSIQLEFGIEGEPFWVRCDRDRVLQIFSNLIGNAIKFTGPGGRVRVEAGRRTSGTETFAYFSVADSGPGISPEEMPHVFSRFWQAKRTAREGTGLGLFIAKGLVDAHGGRIWAESEPGRGATFRFELPDAEPIKAVKSA